MNVVYATTNAVVALPGGGQVVVRSGSHWDSADPAVIAQPSLFSTDPRYGLSFSVAPPSAAVETASAAPGEKRSLDPRNMRRAT